MSLIHGDRGRHGNLEDLEDLDDLDDLDDLEGLEGLEGLDGLEGDLPQRREGLYRQANWSVLSLRDLVAVVLESWNLSGG